MSNKEYSQREIELISHFHPNLAPIADTFTPYVLYRMCVERVFVEDMKGPAVDALRRAYTWLSDGKHRMTPEFEALLAIDRGLWQPIQTAPWDGTWILLRGGTYDDYHELTDDDTSPPAVVGKYSDYDKFWRYCSYDSGFYGVYRNPQEWMPLPK